MGHQGIGDDYTASRVPPTARSSFLSVALVRIGMTTSLSQFMLGAMLGNAMTLNQAMLATVLGSLIQQHGAQTPPFRAGKSGYQGMNA